MGNVNNSVLLRVIFFEFRLNKYRDVLFDGKK